MYRYSYFATTKFKKYNLEIYLMSMYAIVYCIIFITHYAMIQLKHYLLVEQVLL